MCGIAGLVGKKGLSQEIKSRFIKSSRLMDHRGPDAFGTFDDEKVLLIHLRLSIIDLDARSNQPFKVDNPTAVGIFNGELYNFKDLKKKYSIETTTHSDTEVLIKSFLQYGVAAVEEWNGIVATAIYDIRSGKLSLIRDRYGVKPMYIYEDDEYIAFSSEAKVILDWLKEFSLCEKGISQYLWYGNTIDGETMIKGLRKQTPATIITITTQEFIGLKEAVYWKNPGTNHSLRNEQEIVNELKKKVESAVERQLVADVPIGVLLSGGIDSSALVAYASRSISNLDTYSVFYDYNLGGKSEIEKARLISRKFGTNFNELKISAKNIIDDFDTLIFQFDEPFADPASIPLYQLAKECSHDKKVILQGDGGDEFFAGYRRYNILSNIHFWKTASNISSLFIQGQYKERMKRLAYVLNQKSDAQIMAQFLTQEVPFKSPYSILNKNFRFKIESKNPFEPYDKMNNLFKDENIVQKMLYTDVQILLPNTFLEKVDKATMKCSIEARVPFLDHELTSFALSLPSKYKVRSGEKKYLLKKALRGIVPDSILDAPKRGFDVPYNHWLKSDLFDYAMNSFDSKNIDTWLDTDYLKNLLLFHKSGEKNYAPQLWKSIILAKWLNRYSHKIKLE